MLARARMDLSLRHWWLGSLHWSCSLVPQDVRRCKICMDMYGYVWICKMIRSDSESLQMRHDAIVTATWVNLVLWSEVCSCLLLCHAVLFGSKPFRFRSHGHRVCHPNCLLWATRLYMKCSHPSTVLHTSWNCMELRGTLWNNDIVQRYGRVVSCV